MGESPYISKIEKSYNIGEIKKFYKVSTREFILQSSQGKFAFRKLTFTSQMKRMYYDINFTEYLASRGYPARRFIKTIDNELLFDIDGEKYFLIEYFDGAIVPNSRIKLSDKQLSEAAIMLAKLHILSKEYSGPRFQHLPFNSHKSYKTLSTVMRSIAKKQDIDDFDKLAAEVIQIKKEFIMKNPFEKLEFLKENRLMNHGDYHAGNIVFGGDDHIIAVLDFEFCTEMPRIWDLSWAITWLCRELPTEAFAGQISFANLRTFLNYYNIIYPLTEKEKLSLTSLCISSCYHTTYFLEHYYLLGKGIEDLDKCRDIDEWLWWPKNSDRISEIILD